MQKPASEAFVPKFSTDGRRMLRRIVTSPFTGSAMLLVLFLLSIITDVAGRFGVIPFGLMLAFHLRSVRGRGSS